MTPEPIPIYNIRGFENPLNGYVEDLSEYALYANHNRSNRVTYTTSCAAISRGREYSVNPNGRYEHLKREAALSTASRPLELCGCIINYYLNINKDGSLTARLDMERDGKKFIDMDYETFSNKIAKFSFIKHINNGMYQLKTNLRALLNAGITEDQIPFNKTLDGYRVFKMQVPMFVFNQLVTHTMISKETRSDRVTRLDHGKYWLPEDFIERLTASTHTQEDIEEELKYHYEEASEKAESVLTVINNLKEQYSLSKDYDKFVKYMLRQNNEALMLMFKILGYKKEIYQRSMLEFRYKEVIMGAWDHELTWRNLLLERGGDDRWKNWVQPETKKVAEVLAKLLEA